MNIDYKDINLIQNPVQVVTEDNELVILLCDGKLNKEIPILTNTFDGKCFYNYSHFKGPWIYISNDGRFEIVLFGFDGKSSYSTEVAEWRRCTKKYYFADTFNKLLED